MNQKTSWFKKLFRVGLKEVVLRFPFAVIAAITAAGLLSYVTWEEWEERIPAIYSATTLTTTIGIVFFTALVLFAERKKAHTLKWQVFGLIPLAIFYISIYGHLSVEDFPPYPMALFTMLLFASFAFLMISAYIHKKNELGFWQFSKWLLLRMFLAMFSSVVLFAALSLAIVSVDKLFGVDIDDKYYLILWEWIAIVFAPIFVLLGAKKLAEYDSDTAFPEIVRKFAYYILSPILVVYFLILYAYMAKILFFVREWPEGSLALPVIIYTSVVIATMLLTFPWYRREQTTTGNKTLKYLFFSVIPVLPMYFIALGIRIAEYGITEMRYLGVAVGIWFTFVILSSLITKFQNIRVMFGTLAAIIFLSAVGPWSMFSVSYISQSNHLSRVLAEEGLLEPDGKFNKKLYDARSYEENEEIDDTARYLSNWHSFSRVQDIFPVNYTISGVTPSEQISEMLEIDSPIKIIGNAFHYYSQYAEDAYDLEGYDRMWVMSPQREDEVVIDTKDLKIIAQDQKIIVTIDGTTLEKDISAFVTIAEDDLKREFIEDNSPFIWNLQNDSHRIKMLVQGMFGQLKNEKITSLDIEGVVFVGRK